MENGLIFNRLRLIVNTEEITLSCGQMIRMRKDEYGFYKTSHSDMVTNKIFEGGRLVSRNHPQSIVDGQLPFVTGSEPFSKTLQMEVLCYIYGGTINLSDVVEQKRIEVLGYAKSIFVKSLEVEVSKYERGMSSQHKYNSLHDILNCMYTNFLKFRSENILKNWRSNLDFIIDKSWDNFSKENRNAKH